MSQTPIKLAERIKQFCHTIEERRKKDAQGTNALMLGYHDELQKAAAGPIGQKERAAVQQACQDLLTYGFAMGSRTRRVRHG